MWRSIACGLLLMGWLAGGSVSTSDYVIDPEWGHAFIQFRIGHLGFSWLSGRFNRFSGEFSYDENEPETATVEVEIETASIDTNHAERDKHLRKEDILHVARYPSARFVSTSYRPTGVGSGLLTGELTLHGVTRPIAIQVKKVGSGTDPWGGYRMGFEGATQITLADFGITTFLGAAARRIQFELGIQGIGQQRPQGP